MTLFFWLKNVFQVVQNDFTWLKVKTKLCYDTDPSTCFFPCHCLVTAATVHKLQVALRPKIDSNHPEVKDKAQLVPHIVICKLFDNKAQSDSTKQICAPAISGVFLKMLLTLE